MDLPLAQRFSSTGLIPAILILFVLCWPGTVPGSPIQVANQGPLQSLFGLPAPRTLLDKNASQTSARLSLANNFIPRENAEEMLLLDGETLRLDIGLQTQLNQCWSLGFSIPFLEHSGGSLDSFVDDWHEVFGLPESGRPLAPTDRLLYRYERQGVELVNIDERVSGIGDPQLSVVREMGCSPLSTHFSLRMGLKLPIGNPDKLMGSGGTDIYVDISRQSEPSSKGLQISGTAGLLLMETSEIFPNQRNALIYGTTAVDWIYNPRLSFQLQLTLHSPFFKSSLRVLDDWAVMTSFGGRIQLTPKTLLELAMSEDPVYGTSPDVVFHLGLITKF